MQDFRDIPDKIRDRVFRSRSLAVWPIDESPMTDSYQTARFFQDEGWDIYPIHDILDRILEVACYRDIRLIPDDYDILLLFCDLDRLPEVVNAIFNADFIPPIVWAHTGRHDLFSIDRLTEQGIMTVMDRNLKDFYLFWRDRDRPQSRSGDGVSPIQ